MNYKELCKYGEDILKKADITEYKIDAERLLLHYSGKDKTFLLTEGEKDAGEALEQEYREAVKKRASRVPLQLITGCTEFMGLEFLTSDKVLIPRIDTEFVAEEALRIVGDGERVLDLCTGSGCILLSVMRYKNNIEGTGADISPDAISLAKRNAEKLGVKDAVFIESDMFENIRGSFDHIISNPPYIQSSLIPALMEEVRCHEPHNALDGGEDGLLFYREIALKAKEYLKPGGSLILETGYDEGESVKGILEEKGYRNIQVIKDYSGNERVVTCLKS